MLITFIAACAFLLSPVAAASVEPNPAGFWKTTKRDGVNISLWRRLLRTGCRRCYPPSKSKTNRHQKPRSSFAEPGNSGPVVLKNFKGRSGEWSGGPLYDPDTGDSIRAIAHRAEDYAFVMLKPSKCVDASHVSFAGHKYGHAFMEASQPDSRSRSWPNIRPDTERIPPDCTEAPYDAIGDLQFYPTYLVGGFQLRPSYI